MQIFARARRLAVIGVVITGAAASIATSSLSATLEASLQIPSVQLSKAHPVATYRLHATGKGSVKPAYNSIFISASTAGVAPSPILLSASSSVDIPEQVAPIESTSVSTSVTIDCDSLPCADDVDVRIELRPRPDGTWPEPSEWTMFAELRIEIDDRRDVPPGTTATLELVP